MTNLTELQTRLESVDFRYRNFENDTQQLEDAVQEALDKERDCRGRCIIEESKTNKAALTKAQTAVSKAEAELKEHRKNKDGLIETRPNLRSEISRIEKENKQKRQKAINKEMPEYGLCPDLIRHVQVSMARIMVASSLKSGTPLGDIDPKIMARHVCLEHDHLDNFKETLIKAQDDLEKELGL